MIRSDSRLERILHQGKFAVTAEVVPPRSSDPGVVTEQARALVGYADAVNVTDNPTGAAHMSALAGAALVAEAGLEPVLQLTTRDRNRLGLTGDPASIGDHPHTRAVRDIDVLDLIRLVASLRNDGTTLSGQAFDPAPRFFIGVADVPLAREYDPARLEQKADAGADFVQTQIVYDTDAFGAWAETVRPRGIFERMFVLPGVAPPRGPQSVRYMREHLPGVVVPDSVIADLEAAGDPVEAGVQLTIEVMGKLRAIRGIAGVHVMGLGKEDSVRRVIDGAGLLPRPVVA